MYLQVSRTVSFKTVLGRVTGPSIEDDGFIGRECRLHNGLEDASAGPATREKSWQAIQKPLTAVHFLVDLQPGI